MNKKEKNALKKQKRKKQDALITVMMSFAIVLLCLPLLGICIHDYLTPAPTYDTLTHKEYTFESYANTNFSGLYNKSYQTYLYVAEEEVPLLIQNTHAPKIQKELNNLSQNDTLYCYVRSVNHPDCSHEIIEIGTEKPFMTLSQYNRIANQNNLGGIILIPIIMIIMGIVGTIYFIRYRKIKEKEKAHEREKL